jgi:AcrR family transcriptional regulator
MRPGRPASAPRGAAGATPSKNAAARGSHAIGDNAMKERIAGAAFRAFIANGYAGTSTLEIATRAKVSKRDLYAHFGNKQAILLACIASRAARMRLPPSLSPPRDRAMLAATLTAFGSTILREVCAPAVTAMYRLAVAEAERAPEVARTLNENRMVNRNALADLLAQAQRVGILGDGDPQEMMEQFFGLLWGDLMLTRLLGLAGVPKPAEIEQRAGAAAAAFLKLHAA